MNYELALYILFVVVGMSIITYLIFKTDADRQAKEFTKTDLVILMQILNKVESNTPAGHNHLRHLPRIIKKVDEKLLNLIENEGTEIHGKRPCKTKTMKKLLYILILLILPLMGNAQLNLNIGVLDVQDRQDGNTIAWEVGYTQFYNRIGIGSNIRYSQMLLDSYYTSELNLKYRVIQKGIYRFDVGVGAGLNFDDYDLHPIATIRNSFRIDEGTWLNLDFDNAYRNSKENIEGGWRFETYLMVGIALDVTRIGQRKLKKIKRFF